MAADKGIRQNVNRKFVELLKERAQLGNRAFRRDVMWFAVDELGCTIAAAATHYNHAFKEVKKVNPELVLGLGRPEGKNNGGRKKKVEVHSAPVDDVDAVEECLAALAGECAAHTEVGAGSVADEVETVTVLKKADGSVVAANVTREEADAMIAKAKAAKKATLVIA